jgi:hypothetical protein
MEKVERDEAGSPDTLETFHLSKLRLRKELGKNDTKYKKRFFLQKKTGQQPGLPDFS